MVTYSFFLLAIFFSKPFPQRLLLATIQHQNLHFVKHLFQLFNHYLLLSSNEISCYIKLYIYIKKHNNATWRILFDNKPNLVFLPVICRSVVSVKTPLHQHHHLLNPLHLGMPPSPCRKENPNKTPIKELRSLKTYTLLSISFIHKLSYHVHL